MTTEHTPQWEADGTWVRMGDGVIATIIRVYPDSATDDELIADARKMAATPDLLAALELLQSTMEMEDVDDGICTIYVPSGTVDAIATAIAKARGE